MRRTAGPAVAAVLLALAVFGCADDDSAAATLASDVLRVGLDDYDVRADATAARPGRLRIDVRNVGGDRHDLRVDADGRELASTTTLAQGDGDAVTIEVPPDVTRIELWCTLPGHRRQGMTASLSVR